MHLVTVIFVLIMLLKFVWLAKLLIPIMALDTVITAKSIVMPRCAAA